MTYIAKAMRHQVFERADYRCEYCQVSKLVILSLEIDHILPISLNGKTTLDNLCASCDKCNKYKKKITEAIDPQTNTLQPLFNPRQQTWQSHFRWDETGTVLIGLTPIGRATIVQLKLNRPEALASRKLWVSAGWHPPK